MNETALYAAIEEMRAAEREAEHLTRSARRDRTRRAAAPERPAAITASPATIDIGGGGNVQPLRPIRCGGNRGIAAPFDDIEQW